MKQCILTALRMMLLAALGLVLAGCGKQDVTGQDLTGKWCAKYSSANGDGFVTECFIVQKSDRGLDVLQWEIAECLRCDTKAARAPRLWNMPKRIRVQDSAQLLATMQLQYQNGKLVAPRYSPTGEDIDYEKERNFVIKPSFNCAVAKQAREQAICASPELALLDMELAFTFTAAKEKCDHGGKINAEQNAWWKDELSQCQSGDCVAPLYSGRIAALRKQCPDR